MVPPFVLRRAEVAEPGVPSAGVIEGLDEVEDGHPRLLAGPPTRAGDQLALEGGEERLGEGVVETIADRAHRDGDPGLAAAPAERQAGVLGAVDAEWWTRPAAG